MLRDSPSTDAYNIYHHMSLRTLVAVNDGDPSLKPDIDSLSIY